MQSVGDALMFLKVLDHDECWDVARYLICPFDMIKIYGEELAQAQGEHFICF